MRLLRPFPADGHHEWDGLPPHPLGRGHTPLAAEMRCHPRAREPAAGTLRHRGGPSGCLPRGRGERAIRFPCRSVPLRAAFSIRGHPHPSSSGATGDADQTEVTTVEVEAADPGTRNERDTALCFRELDLRGACDEGPIWAVSWPLQAVIGGGRGDAGVLADRAASPSDLKAAPRRFCHVRRQGFSERAGAFVAEALAR